MLAERPPMKLTLALVGLLGSVTSVAAETDGWTESYEVLGASADNSTLQFKKTYSGMGLEEEWLAIYDTTSGKQRTSQPTYRNCGVSEAIDPTATCDDDKPQIARSSGTKTIDKLHAQHGTPLTESLLVAKVKVDEPAALKAVTTTGNTQVFAGANFEIKVTTKLEGKRLPDPIQSGKTASFSLTLEITGADGWRSTSKVYAAPTVTVENANVSRWTGLYVTGVAIAKDYRAVGLVFGGKPFVITRPKTKPAPAVR